MKFLILVLSTTLIFAQMSSDEFMIPTYTLDGGGVGASTSNDSLLSHVGQPGVIGTGESQNFQGYWGYVYTLDYVLNYPPDSFSLLFPPDDSIQWGEDTLDWEDAADPDGDSVHYDLSVSPDTSFPSANTILVESLTVSKYPLLEIADSLCEMGFEAMGFRRLEPLSRTLTEDPQIERTRGHQGTLERYRGTPEIERGTRADTTAFYWKVKAYDTVGAHRWSDETWSFRMMGPYMCGDVNCDSAVAPSDAFYILNYLGSGPEPCDFRAADTDGNDNVTSGDAFRILSYLGNTDTLDCDEPCCTNCGEAKGE